MLVVVIFAQLLRVVLRLTIKVQLNLQGGKLTAGVNLFFAHTMCS